MPVEGGKLRHVSEAQASAALDRPGRRAQQPEQETHQRALAAAVRPEEGQAIALRELEVDLLENDVGAEPVGDPAQIDEARRSRSRADDITFSSSARAADGSASPWRARYPLRWSLRAVLAELM